MKFVSYIRDGATYPGILDGDTIRRIDASTMREYIALPAAARAARHTNETVKLAGVVLDAPVRPNKNIFCVGRNYLEHAKEGAKIFGRELKLPDVPTFFTKAPNSFAAPGATLHLQANVSSEYDFEAELTIVIGQTCKNVSEADALSVVFGYTNLNDVTARDLQRAHLQWFKGKSLDDLAPFGPAIVSADEVGDAQNLEIMFRLNGVEMQHSNTNSMIFSIKRIIAEITKGQTLEAGDLIATGTPAGVGFAREPALFLKDGDVMEVEIEKLGVLKNTVSIE
jgi:2,4-didehydro-3-deoxy-L-rhamnonate hydrolase